MDKDEFLEQQSVDDDLAEEAWERADGEPEEARELLDLAQLTVKGRLFNPGSNINGVFMLTWDLAEEELANLGAVIVNDSVETVDLEAPHEEFIRSLREVEESPKIMSGYSEELEETLQELWKNPSEELPELSDEEFEEGLVAAHETKIEEAFDFEESHLDVVLDLRRRIEIDGESEEGEGDAAEEQETVNVPSCDVHVTPVQGVSVARLQPDDMIYVEIGEIPEEWSKLEPVLEDLRDDSGLIPARLVKKTHTEDGRLELEVQFGKKVYGSLTCGRDVSLMVPDETREKYDEPGISSIEDVLSPKIIVPAVTLTLLVLLVVLFVL